MRRIGLLGLVMLMGTGCTEITQESQKAGWHARKVIYESTAKIQELIRYQPESKINQAPQTAFCYKAPGDVICYDEPKPYISNRLVGYQGYTSPAVPSTIAYAPENASLVGGPGAPKPVSNLTESIAPTESVVVHSAGGQEEAEEVPGNPDSLLPRF